MATGTDILSYKGDAGLGSNANIPVAGLANLDAINRTTNMLLAGNLARNKDLFDRKKKEQDQLYQAIDSGDIRVGDLLEQDMPTVKEGLDKLDEAYFKRIEKGINDLDAAREYNKAKREAQDRVTQAQMRKHFYDSENQALASETLPRKQSARKQNLEGVLKKGFWGDVTPYQQTQDLDVNGSILSTAANITSQFTDPKNPLMKGKRTVFDYDKTLLSNKDNFLNDVNKRYDQQQLIESIQSLPPQEFTETVGLYNDRIDEYNKLKGFIPGVEGYVAPIEFEVNPQTKKAMIKESMPDFAAKFTLAHQKPFGSVETEFDSKLGAYQLGKERNAISAANANANQLRARTYAALQNKKLSQLNDQEKQVKNIWDNIVDKVGETTVKKGLFGKRSKESSSADYVFTSDIPEGYQNIGGLDAKGLPIRLKPKMINGKPGYETKYYSAGDGSPLEKDFLTNKYKEYSKSGGKGDYNTYVRSLIKQGVVDLELIGENGVGNIQTAGETTRALSNKMTTKGETPVFTEESLEVEEQ